MNFWHVAKNILLRYLFSQPKGECYEKEIVECHGQRPDRDGNGAAHADPGRHNGRRGAGADGDLSGLLHGKTEKMLLKLQSRLYVPCNAHL